MSTICARGIAYTLQRVESATQISYVSLELQWLTWGGSPYPVTGSAVVVARRSENAVKKNFILEIVSKIGDDGWLWVSKNLVDSAQELRCLYGPPAAGRMFRPSQGYPAVWRRCLSLRVGPWLSGIFPRIHATGERALLKNPYIE